MTCQCFRRRITVFALALGGALSPLHVADEVALDAATIQSITGLKGVLNPTEGTFRVAKARDDVPVSVEQNRLAPFMGLTSWATFLPHGKEGAMVMGDMVLFEDEVNPVMSAALNAGLEVTALHNHFFFDQPKVYFMHVGGQGPVAELARGIRAIFDTEKGVRAKAPAPASSFGLGPLPAQNAIEGEPIAQVFGQKGEAKDGMYKVTVGRVVQMAGMDVGNSMGVNTWAAFAGTPEDALVVGDFAVWENELQAVLKTLRAANINIVAIHQHMTGESPRVIFLHYYGRGKALELAQGVKAALNAQPLAASH
jgi:Domain of Unknown Function (DUF1259)